MNSDYRLFFNARVHPLDATSRIADTLLCRNGSIVFVGQEKDINISDISAERIDLQGGHVFPGITDCHTHFAAVALYKNRIQLKGCTSLAEAVQRLRSWANNNKGNGWVVGGGWDANTWQDGQPHKSHLDTIFPERPVALYSNDGHAQWLNSAALKKCDFSAIPGSKAEKNEHGDLTGLVYELACRVVDETIGPVDAAELTDCLNKTYPELYRNGITSLHSMEEMDKFRVFQSEQLQHRLGVRICFHPPASALDDFLAAGIQSGFGNSWLRIGGIKYFVDGSLGSQTAEMYRPLTGLDNTGVEVITQDVLSELVCKAAKGGLSATIHAIGDRANTKALNAIAQAQRVDSPIPLRHRIEHAQILRDQDIPRFSNLDVIASMQPLHISDDVQLAKKYLYKTDSLVYPVNSLLKNGAQIIFGSDMPVADADPIRGMLAAIGRRYRLKPQNERWHAGECISAAQALRAYTVNAAAASDELSNKGTLEVGKVADFFVCDTDILTAGEEQLRTAQIKMTVLNGEIVYSA